MIKFSIFAMLRRILTPFGAPRHGLRFIHQPKPNESDSIFVLGVGNVGKYVAHSLMKQASEPVTLLFHRPSLQLQWQSAGCAIQSIKDSALDRRTGFRVETLPPPSPATLDKPSRTGPLEPIKYIIVATKAYMTTTALKLVKDRLSSTTTILFLQNGIGKPSLSILPLGI